ncbi:anti-sigma factor family protein [Trujillonella humicola]|uniref:anti-sigma factor family protein n=1 Tax=Trujillonella humicola TaxID=3383699 RepID=UPI00390684F4
MTCPRGAIDLGAYALGVLETEERRRVEEHLAGCAPCRAELGELRGLPELLDRVDPAELTGPPPQPPPDLADRVRAVVDQEARPGRRRRVLLVAAALVLAVAAAVGVLLATRPAGPATLTAVAGPVQISVTATGEPGGTDLDVTVTGLAEHTYCHLFVVDRDGSWHDAGEWAATYDGEGWYRGWTDVDRDALAAVVLRDGAGNELIRVAVRPVSSR